MIVEEVNNQISLNVDFSDPFEGPEKLLEVLFAPNHGAVNGNGLRQIKTLQWQQLLDIVKCKILSSMHTHNFDAFLLSESSMFVFPHKIILKTCGTTTLLAGIPKLLEFAEHCGFKNPTYVFYTHKSFNCPELQLPPHHSWNDEVLYLQMHFGKGKAYLVGDNNSEHNWYCYLMSNIDNLPPEEIFQEDETMEIIMTDLLPSRAQQFFTNSLPGDATLKGFTHKKDLLVGVEHVSTQNDMSSDSYDNYDSNIKTDPGHLLGAYVTKKSGIASIYPQSADVAIDSFSFTPCGYSANGVVNSEHYFTIHVTPESHSSYASFETNVPAKKIGTSNIDVIEKVINVFRPGKFSITIFEAEVNRLRDNHMFAYNINGYKRTDKILYEIYGYQMIYVCFEVIKDIK